MSDTDLLKDYEVAKYLGISVQTTRTWRSMDKGPRFVRRNGKVFYPKADLEAFPAEYWNARGWTPESRNAS